MVYATADLHGYPLDEFQRMLKGVGFGEDDFLFVLGDVIDRNGDGGIQTLRWMMLQHNVRFILGNHEAMLLSCDFLFDEVTDQAVDALDADKIGLMTNWMLNGARPTLESLHELHQRDPKALEALLDYLRDAPLYDTVSTKSGDFLLVHSGLGGFSPEKSLIEYTPEELLWTRPAANERYFEDVITILGHTPTSFYGTPDRMFATSTWVDIDTGAASGRAPMLLCLDTLEPYYAQR